MENGVVFWVCWGRMVGRGFGIQAGDDMGTDAIAVYLEQINRAVAKGDATEHTHRPALKGLTT